MLVGFPVNIVVARLLGPGLIGVIGYVGLWQFYGSLAKLGLFTAGSREVLPLLAQGRPRAALRLQNICITSEAPWLFLIGGCLLAASFFQGDALVGRAMLVGAFAFLCTQMFFLAGMVQWSHNRFGLIARSNLVCGLVSSGFTLAGIWWLGVYAPILAPGVGVVGALLTIRLLAGPSSYRPVWDARETLRLMKIGIPLSLVGVFLWGFRAVDRTAVATWLSLTELGYFTFAVQFITAAVSLVADFTGVIQQVLWGALGRTDDSRQLGSDIRKNCIAILVVTCAAANLAQAGFGAFVHWIVPNFVPAIIIFDILVLLLACYTAGSIPNMLLNSAALNKQHLSVILYGSGMGLNFAFAFLAIHFGFGLGGVAAGSVVAQTLISSALLGIVGPYLFQPGEARTGFYASMAAVFALALAVFALFETPPLAYSADTALAPRLLVRVVVAGATWALLGGFVYARSRRLSPSEALYTLASLKSALARGRKT